MEEVPGWPEPCICCGSEGRAGANSWFGFLTTVFHLLPSLVMDSSGTSIQGEAKELPLYSKQEPSTVLNTVDVDPNPAIAEAQRSVEEPTTTASNSLRPCRMHAIDNLRTVLIMLLIVEHTVLETASTAKVTEGSKSITALTVFVGMTRAHVIGMLYFISGFASRFSMAHHSPNPLFFLGKKVARGAIGILGCRSITLATRYLYAPWPEAAGTFYSTVGGKETLTTGPMYYIALLLALDTIFAIFRALMVFTGTFSRKIITSKIRYNITKLTLLIVVEIWTSLIGVGFITFPSQITAFLSSVDAIQPFFPTQYILSFFTGTLFIDVWRFVLFEVHPQFHRLTLVLRIVLSASALRIMLYYYPDPMQHFFSITNAPTMTFPSSGGTQFNTPLYFYVVWITTTYFIIPTSVVALFFSTKALKQDWGLISRTAFIQPFIHMVFVIGTARHSGMIDNIILRCGFVGMVSIMCAWSVAVALAMLMRFGRVLVANMRGSPGVTDEEKNVN